MCGCAGGKFSRSPVYLAVNRAVRAFWLVSAVAVFLFDFVTKRWAIDALLGNPPIVVMPFLRFIYVENTGIAFGIFAGAGNDSVRWGILIVTAIISVVLLVLLWKSCSRLLSLAMVLMLGGAIGNLYDRIARGAVVDFIDVHWENYHWPAFNIADIAINLGALLYAIFLFSGKPAFGTPANANS